MNNTPGAGNTLEDEALYTLLYPMRDKLRISIKWQGGRSEARLIGPGIKVHLGGWNYDNLQSNKIVGTKRPGYTSFSLHARECIRGDSARWRFLTLLPTPTEGLLNRLRKNP